MPRLYYNQTDYEVHQALFGFHAVAYCVACSALWILSLPYASTLIIIWTLLLAYHSYWRTSLEDGMQFRTYNRLRNRFGQDWDLNAPPEEFDLENKKARLEIQLKHVVGDSSRVLIIGGFSILLVSILTHVIQWSFLMLVVIGWLICVVLLQTILRYQLRQTNHRYSALKKKQQPEAPSQAKHFQDMRPRAGYILTIGADGELEEVLASKNHNSM